MSFRKTILHISGTGMLLLALVTGCSGAAKGVHGPNAPTTPAAASCSALAPHVIRFTESVEDAREQTKSRITSYAGLLEVLVTFESAASDLEAQLGVVDLKDAALIERVKRAREVLTKGSELTRAAREQLERSSSKTSPIAQESDAAFRDLRAPCSAKKKPADCIGLEKTLTAFDKTGFSDAPRMSDELAALPIKNPKMAKARDRAIAATRALVSAVEVEKRDTGNVFKLWAEHQQTLGEAFEGLGTVCKDAPFSAGDNFVAETKPDPRKLTVLVKVKPPSSIANRLEELADNASNEYERAFYQARAQGGFGSGFILVRPSASGGTETLVITNRHVVELSDRAELELADGTRLGPAEILYTDLNHDVAVLRPTKKLPFERGFAFSTTGAKDQMGVIATGFPGMGGRPSYQTARGYVSNESFNIDVGAHKVTYVQHTAPIDPGSSGGPLTDEKGEVLGLNTLKVTNREAVALAVPSPNILETIHRADAAAARRASAKNRRDGARLACLAFVGELATKKPRYLAIESMISNDLTAEVGLSAASGLADDAEFSKMWESDSVRAMRVATLLKIQATISGTGGTNPLDTCSEVTGDERDGVRFKIRLANWETRNLAVRVEHGHWKIAQIDLSPPRVSAPKQPAAAPAKKAAPAKPKGKK